jgi:hypothetical protein
VPNDNDRPSSNSARQLVRYYLRVVDTAVAGLRNGFPLQHETIDDRLAGIRTEIDLLREWIGPDEPAETMTGEKDETKSR